MYSWIEVLNNYAGQETVIVSHKNPFVTKVTTNIIQREENLLTQQWDFYLMNHFQLWTSPLNYISMFNVVVNLLQT